jgi:peptidoglycan/LPS O-acetylase OafA/YrhL
VGEKEQSGLPYVAGLDGLRALALITIMLFHLGWSRVPGGVFSVSLFFTLSGYLITQLMISDHARTGRTDLKHFWSRRLRRLGPGSIIVVLAVTVVALMGVFTGERLRGDLLATVGYSANWRFATAGTTYAQLFESTPSPLLHFWTLAIEEQFYVVFPILMAVLLRWRRLMLPTLALLAALSAGAMVLTTSRNVAYYGTHTRAAEFLIGALLALVVPMRKEITQRMQAFFAVGGVIALGVYVYISGTVNASDGWLYQGGLTGFTIISCLLIVAVLVPGPVRSLMSLRPLVELGKVSYSVYLFHWPVFVLLNEERLGFDGLALSLIRLLVSLSLGLISARVIENPIRLRRVLRGSRQASWAFVVSLILAVIAIAGISTASPSALAGVNAPDEFVQFTLPPTTSVVEPQRAPLKILVLGSEPLIESDIRRAIGDEIPIEIVNGVLAGCPVRPLEIASGECESFTVIAQRLLAKSKPDLVVLSIGSAERTLIASLVAALPTLSDGIKPINDSRIFSVSEQVVADIIQPLGVIPVIVVDYGSIDVLSNDIADAGMRISNLVSLRQPSDKILSDALLLIDTELQGQDDRTRVIVIGDSTSFGVAAAINATVGERYSVLWAGGRNCPLVEVARIRWWKDVEFDMENCPTLNGDWKTALDSFAPSIVVAIASIPEQTEQMYLDDPEWYTVSDPKFLAVHDVAMTQMMGEFDSRGVTLMLMNSPEVHGGALGGAPFSQPDRVEAWNAVMQSWVARWPQIHLVDWAGMVAASEVIPGDLRGDGVHMQQEDLDKIIGRDFVPLLDRVAGLVG